MTDKQKRFCEEYKKTGNATKAYLNVYRCGKESTARVNASKLLINKSVEKYLEELENKISEENIADIEEINKFWTDVMRDGEFETKDRLKASELRAKVQGAFINKIEANIKTDINVVVTDEDE